MAAKKDLGKNIEKIWLQTQKQLKKMADEAVTLAKKGEKQLEGLSEKGKTQTEILVLRTKREQLYYKLGKLVATSPKSKRIPKLCSEVFGLNKQIINKKRSLKRK